MLIHYVFVLQCSEADIVASRSVDGGGCRYPRLYRPNDRTSLTDDVNYWFMAEIEAMLFSYRGSVDVFPELGSSSPLRNAKRINPRTV
jgi:hypothetical protein